MIMKKYKTTTSNLQVCHGSYFTVDSKWLAANLYNSDLTIIDAWGSICPTALDISRTPGLLALKKW
jgi:hypothetical protein